MKKHNFNFKSILIGYIPSDPEKHIRGETWFDQKTIRDHELSLSFPGDFFHKAWIRCFFIAAMIVLPLAGLIYGFLKLGLNIDFSSQGGIAITRIVMALSILLFILLLTALSIPAVISDRRKGIVEKERGKGNWKIVPEKEWGRFARMLELSQKRPRV